MIPLVKELCAFRTGVVARDNAALFERIAQEFDSSTPMTLHRWKSGESYNGWLVPKEWSVRKAVLIKNGETVFDGTNHTLGVGYYSKSFSGDLDWAALEPKLVTNPALPDAYMFHCMWQYRPWDADWRLCVPHNLWQKLGPGRYRVELETEYKPGEMLLAQIDKQGDSDQTIVFHSNNCHPHMANDGFAGTVVLIRLMQELAKKRTRFSYRLIVGPEHLGTIFYLRDRTPAEIERIAGCIFEEMPGTGGAIKAATTFRGDSLLDRAFAHVLAQRTPPGIVVPWRKGAGNDETVWEAPGYEVPTVEVTRCEEQFAPYREYHSSLDTPDLMQPAQLAEMLAVLRGVVSIIEDDCKPQRTFDGLICLSNPEYDLYQERPDPAVSKGLASDSEKWGHLLDSLFRYFDGDMTILDIAERHELPFGQVRAYLGKFERKGLIRLSREPLKRHTPKRLGRK
jgi:aminopeptidase-like protein